MDPIIGRRSVLTHKRQRCKGPQRCCLIPSKSADRSDWGNRPAECLRWIVGQFVNPTTGYKTEPERDGKGGTGYGKPSWYSPEFNWRNVPGLKQTDEHPVVNVTWNDALAFCKWLSTKEGKKYSLPTEAEWEFSCRAGSTETWSFGNNRELLHLYAWFGENPDHNTHPVGTLRANGFGLHDMHGNVEEWCADEARVRGTDRAKRGGSFTNVWYFTRSATRTFGSPTERSCPIGFRVKCDVMDSSRPQNTAGALGPRGPVERVKPSPSDVQPAFRRIPELATAPFAAEQAKEYQQRWAECLNAPASFTKSIGMKFVLIPPGTFMMGSPP